MIKFDKTMNSEPRSCYIGNFHNTPLWANITHHEINAQALKFGEEICDVLPAFYALQDLTLLHRFSGDQMLALLKR